MTIKQLAHFIFLWWGQIDGDGLLSDINNRVLIQWGYLNNAKNNQLINFTISFSTTNYYTQGNMSMDAHTGGGYGYWYNRTVSSCVYILGSGAAPLTWLAIGY